MLLPHLVQKADNGRCTQNEGLADPCRPEVVNTMPSIGEGTKSLEIKGFLKAKKATMGFEPMMRVLQTLALPLGDVARQSNKTPIACVGNAKPVAIGERAGDGIRTHDLLLGKETFYH